MKPGSLRAVLFDWDGTLADSAEASYRCYVKVFEAFGIAFDRDAYGRTYSPNWLRTYDALGLPRERWDEADLLWVSTYACETVELIDDARAAIERLAAAGLTQGIVTSGDCARVNGDLARLGLAPFFPVVVCAQQIVHRKPHPEALELALARLEIPAAEAAYVGDSPEDVEMARAAGVFSVGVPGRFPNREALAAARPDLLAATVTEAVDVLLRRVS